MSKNKNVPKVTSSTPIATSRHMQATHTQSMSLHVGPIPNAEQLAKYESIFPGAADRIIAMAEKQSNHRHDIEKTIIKSNARDSLIGVLSAFILGVLTIVGGIFLAYNGLELSGAIIGTAGLV